MLRLNITGSPSVASALPTRNSGGVAVSALLGLVRASVMVPVPVSAPVLMLALTGSDSVTVKVSLPSASSSATVGTGKVARRRPAGICTVPIVCV